MDHDEILAAFDALTPPGAGGPAMETSEIRIAATSPDAMIARLQIVASDISRSYDRLTGGRGTAEERASLLGRLDDYEMLVSGGRRAGRRLVPDDFAEREVAERVYMVRRDLADLSAPEAP